VDEGFVSDGDVVKLVSIKDMGRQGRGRRIIFMNRTAGTRRIKRSLLVSATKQWKFSFMRGQGREESIVNWPYKAVRQRKSYLGG
jgi:hypothetical protein